MKNRPLIIIEPQAHEKLNPPLVRGSASLLVDQGQCPCPVIPKTLKTIFTATLLDSQPERERKPISSLVGFLEKALSATYLAGPSCLHFAMAQSDKNWSLFDS